MRVAPHIQLHHLVVPVDRYLAALELLVEPAQALELVHLGQVGQVHIHHLPHGVVGGDHGVASQVPERRYLQILVPAISVLLEQSIQTQHTGAQDKVRVLEQVSVFAIGELQRPRLC